MTRKKSLILAFSLAVCTSCGDNETEPTSQTDSCDGVDCSGHGDCAVQNGAARCFCNPGYIVDELSCVVASCTPGACSGHGQCVEVSGQATCQCDQGFQPVGLRCELVAADAPRILDLSTNLQTIHPGETLSVSVVVTDPDGIDDVIGGTLKNPQGASLGSFATAASEGAYSVSVTWAQWHAIDPINDEDGLLQRTLVAHFFDQAGHEVTRELSVTLTCRDAQLGVCDGQCVDLSADEDNCGQCGSSCPDDANGLSECGPAGCILECRFGYRACGGVCADCPSRPFASLGCQGQDCVITSCEDGLELCDNRCVDLNTDPNHCGECGGEVPSGYQCVDGEIVLACENPSLIRCDGVCVNISTDANNCGGCGNVCPPTHEYLDWLGPRCSRGDCLVAECSSPAVASSCDELCEDAGYECRNHCVGGRWGGLSYRHDASCSDEPRDLIRCDDVKNPEIDSVVCCCF